MAESHHRHRLDAPMADEAKEEAFKASHCLFTLRNNSTAARTRLATVRYSFLATA